MKKKLCFQKYRNSSVLYSFLFVVCVLLTIAMPGALKLMGLIIIFVAACFAAYHIYAYFSYQKKAENLTPSIGTISNWKLSGHRGYFGCVVLNLNGVEYCSPNYFQTYEAEEMVGKEVSYVIVEETLLIYEVFH